MEESLLKQIQQLVLNLPPKDLSLGREFIEKRNFESLKELVDSAIQIDKNRVSSGKESLVKDFTGLVALKVKVDKYCSLLEIPEQEEEDYFSYFDDCENWDEYD